MSERVGLGEQLSRLALVSATLLRRAWWQAGVATLILALPAYVVVRTYTTLLGLVPRSAAWLQLIGIAGLALLGELAGALVLAGPLAAFTLARASEEVALSTALWRAIERMGRVFVVAVPCGSVAALVALLIATASDDRLAAGILIAFASYLAPTFVLAPGFLGFADAVSGARRPAGVFQRAMQLSRGHRMLTLVALATAALPAIAGSSSAFATSFTLGPLALVAPIAGGVLSVYAFALLAVAAHAVASGEGGEDA